MKIQFTAVSIVALFAAGATVASERSTTSEGSATSERSTNQAISSDPYSIQPEGGPAVTDDSGHDHNSRKKLSQGKHHVATSREQAGQAPDALPSGAKGSDSDFDYVSP